LIKKNIAVIIQCRLSSSRLRNKIILKIKNKPIIFYLIKRLQKINCDKIIFALANEYNSNYLGQLIKKIYNQAIIFKGSKTNVLQRTIDAAEKNNIEHIIRITSDCPFFDPYLVNQGIDIYLKNNFDYFSNNLKKSFPHGLDFEIFKTKILKKSHDICKDRNNLEHVTWFIKKSKKFKKINFQSYNNDIKKYRVTLDYLKDYILFKKLLNQYSILEKKFDHLTLIKIIKDYSNKKF